MSQYSFPGKGRRRVLAAIAAAGGLAALLTLPSIASAQAYPAKPVKVLVLSAPGAMGDILARLTGRHLQTALGQPVVIENRPGAGGHVSGEAVARSAPDGYTVLFGVNSMFGLAPVMFPNLSYDPENDLVPAGYISEGMHLLLTNVSVGTKTLDEFIAYAKQKGSSVNFGSGGSGHPLHLYVEQLQSRFGTQMTHVPYNGMPAAINALSANDVQFLVTGTADSAAHVRSGRLQILATTGPVVKDAAPANTPNLDRAYPDLAYSGWVGLWVPKKTPAEVVTTINRALNALADSPEFQKDMLVIGNVPMKGSPADVQRKLNEDIQKIRDTARRVNLKV